jgi:hypothetical protein
MFPIIAWIINISLKHCDLITTVVINLSSQLSVGCIRIRKYSAHKLQEIVAISNAFICVV